MNTRSIIYAGFGLLVLAFCYHRWSGPRPIIYRADAVMSPGSPLGSAVSLPEKQGPASVAETAATADSALSSRDIHSRGLALHGENRKVRENLAAGDFSALPDSSKWLTFRGNLLLHVRFLFLQGLDSQVPTSL